MTGERGTPGQSPLDERLAHAFRTDALPVAPGRLRDALERVPDGPLVAGRAARGGERRGRRAGAWSVLGIAAVLALGGALGVSLGQRGPSPVTPSASPAVVSPSTAIGTRLTYTFEWRAERPENAEDVRAIETIVRQRLDMFGVEGSELQIAGLKAIAVQLPAGVAPEALRPMLRATGAAAFVPLGQEQMSVGEALDPGRSARLFGSEGVESAAIDTDQLGKPIVTFQLTPEAGRAFESWTSAHIGESFAIVIDGRVVSAPVIQAAIPGGEVQITSGDADGTDLADARFLAAILDSGPYPVALREFEILPQPSDARPLVTPPGVDPTIVPTAIASASAEPERSFPLVRVRGDLGCDTILPPYRSWVFHLDPDAADPVWAIADTGARLRVEWGSEFRGLVGPPPVIVDGAGLVVVREGTPGAQPDRGWPSLGDHFVCPGPDTLYVFNDPLAS